MAQLTNSMSCSCTSSGAECDFSSKIRKSSSLSRICFLLLEEITFLADAATFFNKDGLEEDEDDISPGDLGLTGAGNTG